MTEKTKDRWVVELTTTEGEVFHEIFDTPDALGNFVRVNALDASRFRISATKVDTLAQLRIYETFDEDAS